MPLRNHTCEKCGRQFKVPESLKTPFCLCGHNAIKPTSKTCIHRGQRIATLDCGCGGDQNVYHCEMYREPCTQTAIAKPWESVKVEELPGWGITYQPITCSFCPMKQIGE